MKNKKEDRKKRLAKRKAQAEKRKAKNEEAQAELGNKMSMFDRIPEKCLTCSAKFDKKNRQHAMTWTVVVKEKENKVNLYCPTCVEVAKKVIEENTNASKTME